MAEVPVLQLGSRSFRQCPVQLSLAFSITDWRRMKENSWDMVKDSDLGAFRGPIPGPHHVLKVPGDHVWMRFQSDSSEQAWGVRPGPLRENPSATSQGSRDSEGFPGGSKI